MSDTIEVLGRNVTTPKYEAKQVIGEYEIIRLNHLAMEIEPTTGAYRYEWAYTVMSGNQVYQLGEHSITPNDTCNHCGSANVIRYIGFIECKECHTRTDDPDSMVRIKR